MYLNNALTSNISEPLWLTLTWDVFKFVMPRASAKAFAD